MAINSSAVAVLPVGIGSGSGFHDSPIAGQEDGHDNVRIHGAASLASL